jgi:O-antigen/teichoic acid export membrane protein
MKDILVSGVAYVALALTNIATGVLAARILGPDGRGELAAVLLWPQLFAALTAIAVVDAVVYWIANKDVPHGRVLATAAALGLSIGIPTAAVGMALVPYLYADYRPEVREAATIFFVYVPLGALALHAIAVFQGGLRLATWNLLRVLVNGFHLGFILVFLAIGVASVFSFATSLLLANLAILALTIHLIRRAGWLGWRPDFALMKRFVIYIWPIHLGNVLLILNARLDQILISQWQTASSFGFYAVALGLMGAASGFITLLSALAFPKIASQETAAGKIQVLGRYLRLSILVAVLAAAALIALAPWVIELLFAADFLPASPVLRILAVGAIAVACKTILVQGLKAHDRTGPISRAELVALAINGVGLLILLRAFGIAGAAGAFVLSQTGAALYLALATRRALDTPLATLFRPTIADWRLAVAGLRARGRTTP